MKKERIFWGLFLIFGAVFLIVSKLGLVEGIGFWTVTGFLSIPPLAHPSNM